MTFWSKIAHQVALLFSLRSNSGVKVVVFAHNDGNFQNKKNPKDRFPKVNMFVPPENLFKLWANQPCLHSAQSYY